MKHNFWTGFLKEAGAAEVATVAVLDGDKILMGKRKDNEKWTTPGGHMDPGETPVDGAARELFEESGIKAEPKDLEHLATKNITKPDGKKLIIHAFKFDEGKHKTSIKGDPDEEVYRWLWKPLPLPAEVADNLHVQKGNVLFDALGIEYPQEKKASQLMDLVESMPISKAIKKLKKQASFYNAVVDHMSAAPRPPEEKTPAQEQTEDSSDEVPQEVKVARSTAEKLYRLRLRRGEIANLGTQAAQYMSTRENEK